MYILDLYFLYAIANPLLDQLLVANRFHRLTPTTSLLRSEYHSLLLSCQHPVGPNRTSSSTRPHRSQDHHSPPLRFCHQLCLHERVRIARSRRYGRGMKRGERKTHRPFLIALSTTITPPFLVNLIASWKYSWIWSLFASMNTKS